jgi:hypothetical protein
LSAHESNHFRQIVSQFFAGKLPQPLSAEDERILAKGMGVGPLLVREMGRPGYWPTQGFGNILQVVLPNSGVLKRTVKTATDEELCGARDEVRAVIENFDGLRAMLETMAPPSAAFKKFAIRATNPSPGLLQSAVVMWLLARRLPVARALYAGILQLCVQPRPTEQAKR